MTPAARPPRVPSFSRRFTWIACLATMLAACRVGGPETPPPIADAADASTASPDAGAASDTAADVAAIDVASDGGGSCEPPFSVEGCEPVCNTGCPALLRCDASDVSHTGTCVGIWITQEGDACFKGDGTDACAVGLTCLEGKCARLCYHDSDCSRPGACCARELSGPAGKTGFRTCLPCPMSEAGGSGLHDVGRRRVLATGGRRGSRLSLELQVERDVDFVADGDAAGL